MIRKRIRNRYLLPLLLFLCTGCSFSHEEALVDNYYLVAVDVNEDMSISYSLKEHGKEYEGDYIGIVPQTVFSVGYNDKFIIAKQHPIDPSKKMNRHITNYYIIPLVNKVNASVEKNIVGPMTEKEFDAKCAEWGISGDIEFTKVFEDLK